MERSKEQQAAFEDFDRKAQEITLDSLSQMFKSIDVIFKTPPKSDAEYRDEAMLRLAVARANFSAAPAA